MRILQSLSYTGYWTYPLILQTHIWRLLGIYIVCLVAFKYGGYKFNICSDYQVGFATSAYCSPRLLHFPNVSHMIKSLSEFIEVSQTVHNTEKFNRYSICKNGKLGKTADNDTWGEAWNCTQQQCQYFTKKNKPNQTYAPAV